MIKFNSFKFLFIVSLLLAPLASFGQQKKLVLDAFLKPNKILLNTGIRRVSVSYSGLNSLHYGLSSNFGYRFTVPYSLFEQGSRPYFGIDVIRTNYFRGSIDFNRITILMYGARAKAGLSTLLTKGSSIDFDVSYQVEEIFGQSLGANLGYSKHLSQSINFFTDLGYRKFQTYRNHIQTSELSFNFGFGVSF